ncbi:type IX secretion system motor protein PorL/GldL [Taibaiella koreensis]|uniref:type IX secretion system motor protein PorL/GldL n=1 Tax=Taibaiella koreensis TaxID=1268548 RepID=UPI000E599BAD|nr:gliding motility protein GldL [Taibaiella koreensis]
MGSISLFFETKQGKYIKNLIIGVGAGVVLLGALFKIQHWEGASLMLTVGMCTEAFIFCLLGILPPHKDYYWERYYPNLDENPHVEAYKKGLKFKPPVSALGESAGGGSNATASLDKLLDDANINAPNLKRLNENFQRFGQTVEQMKDITDVTAATGTYSQSAREAADALGQMKNTFIGATNTLQSFNNAADSTAQFHQQVQVLSKNLGSLNQIYEVELQDANNHLKAMNKFYSNLVNASDAMASSASDAVAAKEQIATLSKNLAQLNNIYGNMLSAMQGR